MYPGQRQALPLLGTVIQTFKSICATDYLKYIKKCNLEETARFWQKNYYEHIIRNENELAKIRKYIQTNPHHWANDGENPVNL